MDLIIDKLVTSTKENFIDFDLLEFFLIFLITNYTKILLFRKIEIFDKSEYNSNICVKLI